MTHGGDPETPLARVLGPKTAKGMAEQLNLHTVRDLLRHYPRRYARRGEMARLDDLQVGDRVTILAQVTSVNTRRDAPAPRHASPRSPSATAPAR